MRKFATTKNFDREIREHYGWTQDALASYLGVGRSLLSLCEMGERSLPSAASLKWLEWIKFTHSGNALEKAKAALPIPPPGTGKLLYKAAENEWEADKLQRKLNALQIRYGKTLNNLALCQHLLSVIADTKENASDRGQLELAYNIATINQKREGPEAQALLQCKIDGLLHEAKQCRQRAAALEKEKDTKL